MIRPLLEIASTLVFLLQIAIFARAIISWFPVSPGNPLVVLLNQITDPILRPLRRVVPRVGMFDLAPMIAIVVLVVVGRAIGVALRAY